MSNKSLGVREQSVLGPGYVPSGPKCMEYINSDAGIVLIMGPEGSGKSIGSGAKMLWAAQQQAPSPHDGIIRVKGYIIRATYRDLWDKTIPSYWQCWPKNMPGSTWQGGKGEPATHTIQWREPCSKSPTGYKRYEAIHEFRAIGENTIDAFVAGLEPTWIYCNEVNTLPRNVLSTFYRRCGRYPAPKDRPNDGVKRWFGVFGDFNAEDEAHWLFHDCMDGKKAGVHFIQQPSGFSPQAENLRQLRKIDPDYYQNKAKLMEGWQVKRMIENKWGFSRTGEPVFGEDWDDDLHVATSIIEPDPRHPVYVGADAGGSPAAIFFQYINGCMIVFDELTTPDGLFWDAETFGQKCRNKMDTQYPNCKVEWFAPDPSAGARLTGGAAHLDEEHRNWISIFAIATKWKPNIPTTNDIGLRLQSVRRRLRLGKRGYLVSSKCVMLRSGFNSGYKLGKVDPKDGATPANNIRKNRYSHVQDANQAGSLCLPLPDIAIGAEDQRKTAHILGDDYDLPVNYG
jgi:hypothetical protein